MTGKPLRHDRKRFFIRHADARDYGVVPDAGGIVAFGVGEDSNSYHLWLQGIQKRAIFEGVCAVVGGELSYDLHGVVGAGRG